MGTLRVAKRTFGNSYDVHRHGTEAPIMLVKDGVITATGGGEQLGRLVENFWNTRATIRDAGDAEVGHLAFSFPLIPRGKRFTLHLGDRAYTGSFEKLDETSIGGVSSGVFRCTDGKVAILEVEKELAVNHRFVVRFEAEVSPEVAVLAAVALDRRFFQLR